MMRRLIDAAARHCWRRGARVCWTGLVDAADVARRFALGEAPKLSDGPVTRGKQGVVWRLDTGDGSWAVKVPFAPSGEDEVRSAAAFQEAACAAGVRPRGCGAPRRDLFSRPSEPARSGCMSGSTCMPRTPASIPRRSAPSWPPSTA